MANAHNLGARSVKKSTRDNQFLVINALCTKRGVVASVVLLPEYPLLCTRFEVPPRLEVGPERELDLAIRAETYLVGHGGILRPEESTRRS